MKKKILLILILAAMLACNTPARIFTIAPADTATPTSQPSARPAATKTRKYYSFPTFGRKTDTPATVPSTETGAPSVTPAIFNTPAPGPTEEEAQYIPPGMESIATIEQNIQYCRMGGIALKLDMYSPLGMTSPQPAIVYVHGGSWRGGSKEHSAGVQYFADLVQAGFIVVSVDYRLAPTFQFPAMIEDVKCAIRFLRANAAAYNIDPNHIGALGTSAGGHLAALLGLADESAGWDVGQYLDQSSRVQAVVDMYGPADFTVPDFADEVSSVADVFGSDNPNDPIYRLASPVTYVSAGDPPFLIFHGNMDVIVPYSQSVNLYQTLQDFDVQARLITVENAGHGLQPATGDPIRPSREKIVEQMIKFFERLLR
jgi:acetyl esterase/lipase